LQPQQQQQRQPQQQQHTLRGHAAGPKWVNQLPAGRLPANVRLERNALVSAN
jgi:hypothetical protein